MTVFAAVQMTSGSVVSDNLDKAARLLAEAARKHAHVAVLPENFSLMAESRNQRVAAAENDYAATLDFLSQQARRHGMWVIGGAIPAPAGPKTYSACPVLSPDGVIRARYDKRHLFDVTVAEGESYRESDYTEPGTDIVVEEIAGFNVGLTVCYDIRFPEQYRAMSARGANLFTVPSAFTEPTGNAHWEMLLSCRAVENLSYVVAPAQWGKHDNGRGTWGHSMIVDPWGKVLVQLESGEGVAVADCDPDELARRRRHFPALDHRRDN